ncbi:hypothetical protein AAVH_15322 [Aphelenchoides avenae]|nr:hypothetical protein AAVH_15322 [Aphelenchus avenae]
MRGYFCMLPVKNESLGQPGDSGGPVYTQRGGMWYLAGVYTSHGGVILKYGVYPVPRAFVHVAVDLRPLKSDFCHILGLCIEGKSWRDSVPTLKWNSVYVAGFGFPAGAGA